VRQLAAARRGTKVPRPHEQADRNIMGRPTETFP